MTGTKLVEAALMQFALHGYEGASLSSIAGEVGIKKESIYSHFKSKEHLFKSAFDYSISKEIEFIDNFFSRAENGTLIEKLRNFMTEYIDRYEKTTNTRFLIRNAFYPPANIKEEIILKSYDLTEKLESMLLNEVELIIHKISNKLQPEEVVMTYITILDGLFVEMLYGGKSERLSKRRHSSWKVFVEGIGYKH
ncbi:TetR/AcrR family transcriptional regulator [Terribacillus saccharophilus]|uniref:TetR/AcrR family transcriptional regulator n=1 Tax=Terribacillus saccharophilus TaxID=361277 RepID=UPI003982BA6B